MRTVKILGSRPPVVLSADLEARVLAVLRRMPPARRVVTRIDPALLMPVPRHA